MLFLLHSVSAVLFLFLPFLLSLPHAHTFSVSFFVARPPSLSLSFSLSVYMSSLTALVAVTYSPCLFLSRTGDVEGAMSSSRGGGVGGGGGDAFMTAPGQSHAPTRSLSLYLSEHFLSHSVSLSVCLPFPLSLAVSLCLCLIDTDSHTNTITDKKSDTDTDTSTNTHTDTKMDTDTRMHARTHTRIRTDTRTLSLSLSLFCLCPFLAFCLLRDLSDLTAHVFSLCRALCPAHAHAQAKRLTPSLSLSK